MQTLGIQIKVSEVCKAAESEGIKIHIPRLILSAAIEYKANYDPERRKLPRIRRISKEDPNITNEPGYVAGRKTPEYDGPRTGPAWWTDEYGELIYSNTDMPTGLY